MLTICFNFLSHRFVKFLIFTDYSWPLNNVGLNLKGPLVRGWFSVVNTACVRVCVHAYAQLCVIFQSLPKPTPMELTVPSNYLLLCPPLLPPSVSPSIRVSSSDSALHICDPSIGVSALASVLPLNIQDWFPLGLTGLIFLLSKGLSRVFPSTTLQKHQFLNAQPSLWYNTHIRTWLLEKP